MKGSVHNTGEVLWTNSNVLWIDKFTSNVLSNDEWIAKRFNQYRKDNHIYQQCYNWNRNGGRAWWYSGRSNKKVRREWFVCEAREIQVEGLGGKIFRSSNKAR